MILGTLPYIGSLRRGASGWPALITVGDIRLVLFPQFVAGYQRFWGGGLFGIDFLTDGGASSFAFRPNLPVIYPPYIASYLLFNIANTKTAAIVFCVLYGLHLYAALFFAVLLGRRFLGLGVGASVLFAVLYAFSIQASTYAGQTGFYFQAMLVPCVTYALCCALLARSFRGWLWATPLVVTLMLSNYAPMAVMALAVSCVFVLHVFMIRVRPLLTPRGGYRALLSPACAVVIGCLVAAPYYISQLSWLKLVSGVPNTLEVAAYDLAFTGRDLLRGLSQNLRAGPPVESYLNWGLITVAVLMLGLAVVAYHGDAVSRRLRTMLGFGLVAYITMLMIGFGRWFIASDIFFYSVPVLGTMHIYKRYLLFGQIFFALGVAVAATVLIRFLPAAKRGWVIAGGFIIWVAGSLWATVSKSAASIVDIDGLVPELFLLFVCLCVIALARSERVLIGVAIPIALLGASPIYQLQGAAGSESYQARPISISAKTVESIEQIFIADTPKDLVKVLHLTDAIEAYLPHNYSWLFRNKQKKVMNYVGYDPHLAMEKDYFLMMGNFYGRYDRRWVTETGVDFVVYDQASAPKLAVLATKSLKADPPVSIGGGYSIARIRHVGEEDPLVLDLSENNPSAWHTIIADGWRLDGGRMLKVEGTANHFGIPAPHVAGESYELQIELRESTRGLVDVAFGGSHAPLIPGDQPGVHRLSFKGDGRNDLWIAATPDFDGSVTNIAIRESNPSQGKPALYDNGVFRLEGGEGSAQVSDFKSDWSRRVGITVDAQTTVRLKYLLWPSPYLRVTIDGQPVSWSRTTSRLAYLDIPPGKHRVELRFNAGAAISIFYAALIGLAGALAFLIFQPLYGRYVQRTGSWRRLRIRFRQTAP